MSGDDFVSMNFFRAETFSSRYCYAPTFILRGLTELHIEFTQAAR
jgi:hypothetical protein